MPFTPEASGLNSLGGAELRLLRYALAIEGCGSISAGAAVLGVETSAASRGLRKLEERLGFALFERSHRGAVPTRAGAMYLGSVREALGGLDRAEAAARAVSTGQTGVLRVGFVWSFAFGPVVKLLHELRRHEPTVDVQLVEDGPDPLIARLHDRALDVALTAIEPDGHAPMRSVGELARLSLWTERLLAAMPPAEAKPQVSWSELSVQKLLCRSTDDFRPPPGGEPPICVRGPLLRACLRRLDARLLAPPELEHHPEQVSGPDQWVLRGGSAIIGPDGKYIAAPIYDEPAIVMAELDLRRASEESMTLDVTGHYHRPELFDFRPLRTGRRPAGEGE